MKKKIKKYLILGGIIIIILLALPSIVNTKVIIPFKSFNITLNGNPGYYFPNEPTCENDECTRSSCLSSEDLPEEIKNYKICFCCIDFEFKKDKDTNEKFWKVKDYKIKVFYQDNGEEQEKTSLISNPLDKILLPNFNNRYLSLIPNYSKSPYYSEKYPNILQFNFHRIKISYKAILEAILAKL